MGAVYTASRPPPVPSLSRFSRLGRAKVVPVVTRMTPQGYQVQVLPAWRDFPTGDAEADTKLMNRRLQGYIDAMPAPVLLGAQALQGPAVGGATGLLKPCGTDRSEAELSVLNIS